VWESPFVSYYQGFIRRGRGIRCGSGLCFTRADVKRTVYALGLAGSLLPTQEWRTEVRGEAVAGGSSACLGYCRFLKTLWSTNCF
jgi:hypothetical protein